jgi:large subunit ribosomal protein L13
MKIKKYFKTYSAKPIDVTHNWFLIDAKDVTLGRLASIVAKYLRGKHKAQFTPHIDCGDYIVIVNADKVKLTGKKARRNDGKKYYWHTGHAGGIKETTAGKFLEGKYPERVIELAVRRMMPKYSPLANQQFKKLKIFAGNEHNHEAQQPQLLDLAAMNPKNKRPQNN